MPNSNITLQSVIDYAVTMPDLQPVLAVGGFSQQPALTIANDTMIAMLAPGMNWKWNRFIVPQFYTNSWQQDYAANNVRLGWAEHAFIVDINNTALPPPVWPLEVVRDLEVTSWQYGRVGQVAWLPNNQLTYGNWIANATYTQILGTPQNPGTPVNQIVDPNGNPWTVSNSVNATVMTGATEPTWPTSPAYPTYQSPTTLPTLVSDGSVVWQAINPSGQGFRVNPLPSQSGLYYQINVIGQKRPVTFTNVTQTLEPIPDDYASYFRSGFIAHTYRHSKQADVRARFQTEYQLWMTGMQQSLSKSMREKEEAGFYPSESVMNSGYANYIGPANPYYPGY